MDWETIKKAAVLWYDRDADHAAAMVSYYALFAVVPLLFLSITISGFVYGQGFVLATLASWGSVLGADLLGLLQVSLQNLSALSNKFALPLVGALFFSGMIIVLFIQSPVGFISYGEYNIKVFPVGFVNARTRFSLLWCLRCI